MTMMPFPNSLFVTMNEFPGKLRIGVMNNPDTQVDCCGECGLEAKFQLIVQLTGRHVFSLEDKRITMDATRKPVGLMVRVNHQSVITYHGSFEGPFRKIQLSTPLEWLDEMMQSASAHEGSGETRDPASVLLTDHLDYRLWEVSPEIARLADQLIFPPPEETGLDQSLFRMSRGLEIFRRALSETLDRRGERGVARMGRSAEDMRLYILAHLHEDLSLHQLEEHFHINRRSLQRIFKTRYGVTISDFIRKERLQKAHSGLQQHGLTIAQAAFVAGYSSTANFTTAFRKEFDMPPSLVQRGAI